MFKVSDFLDLILCSFAYTNISEENGTILLISYPEYWGSRLLQRPGTVPVYQQHIVTSHKIFTVPNIRTSDSTYISVFIVPSTYHRNNYGFKKYSSKG